jgi:hypothetical protein
MHHAWQTVYNRIIRFQQKAVRIYFCEYDGVWFVGGFAVISNRHRQRRKKGYIFYSYCINYLSVIPAR